MKKFTLAVILFATTGGIAYANEQQFMDEASVLKANPVYRTVQINQPVEECWNEQVRVPDNDGYESHTPKILGAIVGAAVGNEFGSGRGKDLATVAGAVLGGSIGKDVQESNARKQGSRIVYEKRCALVDRFHTEERLLGYDVTYRYNGHTYSTFTDNDPGSTLTLSVSILPVQ